MHPTGFCFSGEPSLIQEVIAKYRGRGSIKVRMSMQLMEVERQMNQGVKGKTWLLQHLRGQ